VNILYALKIKRSQKQSYLLHVYTVAKTACITTMEAPSEYLNLKCIFFVLQPPKGIKEDDTANIEG